MPYTIIEVANTHGGSFEYLNKLVDTYAEYQGNVGMKFQPLKYDEIATTDFPWYQTYVELFFSEEQWKSVIKKASVTKEIWLDLFDSYGVKILEQNLDLVTGIKFQASVLYNRVLIQNLSKVDLSNKKLILNISSFTVEEIREVIERVNRMLKPKEILLEAGFQSYPTKLEDSGLNKIKTLKAEFNNKLVFADHLDGSTDDAIWFPVMAALQGADVIEKHVMLERADTKYDHFSSLTPERFKEFYTKYQSYSGLTDKSFINESEREYVAKSIMVPVVKELKPAGTLFDLDKDLVYKRSGKEGLNAKLVEELQGSFHMLQVDKHPGETIRKEDFKRANIATIIACRLKSSRLKQKALLPIGDVPSVQYCIRSAMKFSHVNYTVLASSTVEEDEPLKDHTYASSVIFHAGDPDDVVQRYLDVTRKYKIDVIIRVTADMPFIDNEIAEFLLKKHFLSGADYTTANKAAVGTNLEIINVSALEKVKEFFPRADYSEYMTWYFQNNADFFKLNFVDLPEELVRNYRLTLDHDEDLQMFNKITDHFKEHGKTQFSLKEVFKYLDENPAVAEMNQHITLKYKTDQTLIDTLNKVTKIPA